MQEKMRPRRLREEEVPGAVPEGLVDGGHVILSCSNCNALLMDVFRTRPHEPEVWRLRCSCPFCGDASFVAEVRGGFHYGGYGRIKKDDDSDDFPVTVVDPPEIDGETYFFTAKKASPDVRPEYRR